MTPGSRTFKRKSFYRENTSSWRANCSGYYFKKKACFFKFQISYLSCCDTMIYKKCIFGLPPGFLALSLSAKNDKSVSCCVNEMTLGPRLRVEAGCQGNQPQNQSWNFLFQPLKVQSIKRPRVWCSCNEAAIEILTDSQNFWVGEHVEITGGVSRCKSRQTVAPFPVSCPTNLFCLAGCSWITFFFFLIINQWLRKLQINWNWRGVLGTFGL